MYALGAQATKCMPILAQPTIRELPMLNRASPRYTSLMPFSFPKCSWIVRKSARIWVGWNSSVRPLNTGTPAYWASSSTMACPKPRYSMPSYMRPSTRAVSAMDSFTPIWLPVGPK